MLEVEKVAESPAPELETTANLVTEAVQAEQAAPEEQQEAKKEAKSFSQEELDEILAKRLARERRKWEREHSVKPVQSVAQAPAADLPPPDKFESPEAYADALAERKAVELVERREAERKQTEVLEAYHEREEEARTKYDDFEQVVYNPNLPISVVMAETIKTSDVGPELAYYLGSNPKEAERISRLQPIAQAKELGKLEVKLAESPPVKKTSSAPAPIVPVKPQSSGNGSYDTTDPRSVKQMSTSEWIEAERQRQTRKLEALRNR